MNTLFLKSIRNAIKHWYIHLFVGLFFIAVSVIAFMWPANSFLTLAILFSLSFLIGGFSEVVFSFTNRHQLENWGWSLAFGIITAIVGILLLANPTLSMATLAFYVGFVVLFRSIAAISFAVDIKRYGSPNWGGLLTLGILGAVFSFILLWNPVFAGMSVVILISLSFLFAGLFNIYFSFQLKKLHKTSRKLSTKLRERVEKLEKEIRDEWNEWDD